MLTSRQKLNLVSILILLLGTAALTYTYRDTLGLVEPPRDEQVENLRAFAKLYGYVRYFHPSDAAANTDWDAFAIHGVRQVRGAANQSELRAELDALFEPIAPTARLYRTAKEPPAPADILTPSDTTELNFVAWQHRSVGFPRDNVPRKYRRSGADSLRTYRSVRLNRPPGRAPLFEARPAPGETVTKPLGRGLSVQLPLALYSRDGQTLRPDHAPSPTALRDTLSHVQGILHDTNEAQRLADVTIAWNVFQHFYPYFPVVEVDWDRVLTSTFRRPLDDDTRSAFLRTLRRMVAQLQDGHGRVQAPGPPPTGLPVTFDRIEGEVLVVDTAEYVDDPMCVEVGDIVASIDGRSPKQEIRNLKRYISGSPQWKEVRALRQLGRGEPGPTVSLTVQRGKKREDVSVAPGVRLRDRSASRETPQGESPGPDRYPS